MALDFCRLLARDGTPIVSREGGDDYILVRIQTCDYAVAPPVDNSDPAITGGGRVMRKGQFPEWWEEEEEPQPKPEPEDTAREKLAEAAAVLPFPKSKNKVPPPPPKPKKAPPPLKPRKLVLRTILAESGTLGIGINGPGVNFVCRSVPVDILNMIEKEQSRKTAAAMLLMLLD